VSGATLLAASWSSATPQPGRECLLRELLVASTPLGAPARIYAPGRTGAALDGGIACHRLPAPPGNRRAATLLAELVSEAFERALAVAHPPSPLAADVLAADPAVLLVEPQAFATATRVLAQRRGGRTALVVLRPAAPGPLAEATRLAARALVPLVDSVLFPTPAEAAWLEWGELPPTGLVTGLPFPRPSIAIPSSEGSSATPSRPEVGCGQPVVLVLDGWGEPDDGTRPGYLSHLVSRAALGSAVLVAGPASTALVSAGVAGASRPYERRWSPSRRELWSLARRAACVVDLARADPVGRTALEVMHLGVPVVAPTGSAAAAHLELGGGGVSFETPAELLEAISLLLGQPRLRTQLGESAARWADPLLAGPASTQARLAGFLQCGTEREAPTRARS